MRRAKAALIIGLFLFVLGVGIICISAVNMLPNVKAASTISLLERVGVTGGFEQELRGGEYVSILDEKNGSVIDKTSRVVYVGDEVINENNISYRVTSIKGDKAMAKKIGKVKDIVWNPEWDIKPAVSMNNKTQVGIYHTHSAESYVPTDGTDTIPARGGIFKVGAALANTLTGKGVSAIDDKTPHEPQDANAYHRSRRTAVKLLQTRPIALLDVHRDGVPDPDFYKKTVMGENIARIRLVIGRQNPNMAANLSFAKNIKAYMDKQKPGLIKGIFIGKGDYNQDLSPRALLLEVGTHTNDRFRAQKGAAIFADAFPSLLNLLTTKGVDGTTSESKSGFSAVAWILGIVLIGGGTFLIISKGSLKTK
jgi:stage II sporulation protein P